MLLRRSAMKIPNCSETQTAEKFQPSAPLSLNALPQTIKSPSHLRPRLHVPDLHGLVVRPADDALPVRRYRHREHLFRVPRQRTLRADDRSLSLVLPGAGAAILVVVARRRPDLPSTASVFVKPHRVPGRSVGVPRQRAQLPARPRLTPRPQPYPLRNLPPLRAREWGEWGGRVQVNCTGSYWFYTGRGACNALVGISRQSRILSRAPVAREDLNGSTRGRPEASRERLSLSLSLSLSLALPHLLAQKRPERERDPRINPCLREGLTPPPHRTQPNPREGEGE